MEGGRGGERGGRGGERGGGGGREGGREGEPRYSVFFHAHNIYSYGCFPLNMGSVDSLSIGIRW